MSKTAQKKETRQWAIEAPKLDNARSQRGIHSIDREDGECKETIRNAMKKLEVPVEAAMPCQMGTENRLQKLRETASESDESSNILKTKHPCIVEAHESTRNEDHIAENGSNLISHDDLLHQFIPMPQGMKILEAKEAVDQEWEKLEKLLAWQFVQSVKSKREAIPEAQREDKIHFASLMDICHLKNAELEPKCHQKYRDGIRAEKFISSH